jgi:subtilisin family serine protease
MLQKMDLFLGRKFLVVLKASAISLCLLFSIQNANATAFNGYIVKFKPSSEKFVNFASFHTILSQDASVKEVVQTGFGTFARLDSQAGVQALQKKLQSSSGMEIAYVEPNYKITVKNTAEEMKPKDTRFKDQWGLFNSGNNGNVVSIQGGGRAGADINALNAWTITKGSTNVKIAVIDTGVDYNHPDLKNQMDINQAELKGMTGVDDDGNGFVDDIYGYDFAYNDGDPMDGGGHGTHCAGVIGASHNGQGTVGVMANVKIVGIKFLDDEGSGDEINAIKAIDYAIKRKVHVMSNSWGGEDRVQALEDAIVAANEAGIVFLAASGNDAADNDKVKSFPANYDSPNLISVGSFDAWGEISDFSNYGLNSVHVLAPGTDILSTYPGGKYKTMSGTSMATPHAAGIVGLLLSKEPKLTPAQVRERLVETALKSVSLSERTLSGGRMDAFRVLNNTRD